MNLFRNSLLPNFRLNKVINFLLADARDAESERRFHGRVPYFQPASIELTESQTSFSVFTRDVSRHGLGMLHYMPIEPQRVTLTLRCSNDDIAKVEVDVDWCMPCSEGWYISGGTFTSAGDVDEQAR